MTSGTIKRLEGFDYRAERTYFLTFCVAQRKPVFSDPAVCETAKQIMHEYRSRGWYWLNCYCITPDHVHLLIKTRTRQRSLSTIVAKLKRRIREGSSFPYAWHWQPGFHDRVVREYESVRDYARYILANPIRAGLATDVGSYPYSGIVDPWF